MKNGSIRIASPRGSKEYGQGAPSLPVLRWAVFPQGPSCFLGDLSMPRANPRLRLTVAAERQARAISLEGVTGRDPFPLFCTLPSSEQPVTPVHAICGSVLYYPRTLRLSSGEGGISHGSQLNGAVRICCRRCLLSAVQIMKIPRAGDSELSHCTTDGVFVQLCELRFKARLC